MTDREKAIVMAYTGKCMLTGDKLHIFYKYIEDIMGRPVYTHEMGIKAVDDEIREKSKADFVALCREREPEQEPILDKIRAEIAQEYNRLSATRADETLELGECLGLKMSMKIIDKYRAGK